MAIPVFAAFIVLELLVYARLRSRLAPNRPEMRWGKLPRSLFKPEDPGTTSEPNRILRVASLLTLGIALACLLMGLFILVPRPDAFLFPRSDNPFYLMAITGICAVLTLATYAGAVIVAAFVATFRTLVSITEAALGLIPGRAGQSSLRTSPKPPRMSCASSGLIDDWLDGP